MKAAERHRTSGRLLVIAALALVAILGLGALTWWLTQLPPPAKPVDIRTADESTILVNHPADLDVFRFALNPQILVLDFASMKRQGAMMNRFAAMIEKKGLPRDRPLKDEELDRAIRSAGDVPETYYYGHDYSSEDLARVFAAADRLNIKLNADELWLRRLLEQEGSGTPGFIRAVISIPAEGAIPSVDRATRATILHHELSHGEFFTNPRYQAWSLEFWNNGLDADGRAAFTKMLSADNYDPALGELLANETQAYLCFTPEGQFFNPAELGVEPAALEALRVKFRAGMPRGWLKDVAMDGAKQRIAFAPALTPLRAASSSAARSACR
eukprot:gene18108-18348_t